MANCFGDFCGHSACRCDAPGSVAHTLTARERKTMSVLVIGQNRYGHAEDLAAAKKNFQNQGGRLSDGYTIAEFSGDQVYQGVDEMGRVHWTNADGSDRVPRYTEVPPRQKKAAAL